MVALASARGVLALAQTKVSGAIEPNGLSDPLRESDQVGGPADSFVRLSYSKLGVEALPEIVIGCLQPAQVQTLVAPVVSSRHRDRSRRRHSIPRSGKRIVNIL